MAYAPHTLVTISGTLREETAGDEIWEIGVRGLNPAASDGPLGDVLDDYVAAIATPIQTWFQESDSKIPVSVSLDQVKVANIGPDGKYTSNPAIHPYTSVLGNSSTHGFIPSFCSVAFTWGTDGFGRRGVRGRVYPPNFGATLTQDSATISSTSVTALVESARDLLDALSQSGAEFEFRPAVVSSLGPWNYITSVGIGNVVDVQRRRKNAVPEVYTKSPYVWPTP